MMWPFGDLPHGHYGAIYADPPWQFNTWGASATRNPKYDTLPNFDIAKLPINKLAAKDCVLFVWVIFPDLDGCLAVIKEWGFTYKTCAFSWMKADNTQADLFSDAIKAAMTLGYWTRANNEVCLLATRGKPKRLNADVRQGIIEPRREGPGCWVEEGPPALTRSARSHGGPSRCRRCLALPRTLRSSKSEA